jgi:SAM-dependent methyltransferase
MTEGVRHLSSPPPLAGGGRGEGASPYPDFPNTDLLDRIPLDARIVLDVGCGAGALGAAYRRLNPRARVLGIEQDRDAARRAAERLDAVANADVEQAPLPFSLTAGLDCIVYGDVLEHLKDPFAVLRRHAEALSESGTILICVPNVEHWSFAAHLLRGTWDYEDTGLLDRTHLRWFSLESMRRGLEGLGLAPCDVHPRVFEPERAQGFITALAPSLRALGIDPQAYANRAVPLQYVWRVRRRAPARLTVAATMLAPVGGVSHTRVVYPLQAMATDAAVQTRLLGASDALPRLPPEHPRVLVLHRPILTGQPAVEHLVRLFAAGWVVVTEFDDHPDFFKAMQGEDQLSFTGVHAVQTTTPALADVLRARNPELRVFPNAIRALPEPRNFADPGRLTLFFGALNRERDWQPLMPVLNAVAASAGERLRFSVVHDRPFFDALDTPHKRFTPTCDHDTYLRLLGEAEVAFMPLADTEFNRAKSDLKFVEAGACRLATLASGVVYAASVEDGRTGLLFRDAEELRTRLLRLVAMPGLARSLGEAARAYVAERRMLAYQVAERIAWYRSLWARRTELSAALGARVGEPRLAAALRGFDPSREERMREGLT